MTEQNKPKPEEQGVEANLSQDYVPKSKLGDLPMSNQINAELQKQMDKTKKEIEKFKSEITKKFKYVEALGIVPAQASQKIEEEYEELIKLILALTLVIGVFVPVFKLAYGMFFPDLFIFRFLFYRSLFITSWFFFEFTITTV